MRWPTRCAHALRRDARIALVQRVVAVLYWVHPLVPVLNRQLARAREEVCDNVVLSGTSAAEYARTLLALSQTMQATRDRISVVQMFDGRWRLAQRVAGLLNTRRIVMTRLTRRTAGAGGCRGNFTRHGPRGNQHGWRRTGEGQAQTDPTSRAEPDERIYDEHRAAHSCGEQTGRARGD